MWSWDRRGNIRDTLFPALTTYREALLQLETLHRGEQRDLHFSFIATAEEVFVKLFSGAKDECAHAQTTQKEESKRLAENGDNSASSGLAWNAQHTSGQLSQSPHKRKKLPLEMFAHIHGASRNLDTWCVLVLRKRFAVLSDPAGSPNVANFVRDSSLRMHPLLRVQRRILG